MKTIHNPLDLPNLFRQIEAAICALQNGGVTEFSIFLEQEAFGEDSWQMKTVRAALQEFHVKDADYQRWSQAYAAQLATADIDLYDHFLPGKPLPAAV